MRSGAGRAGDEASGGPVLINDPLQPLRRRGQRLKLVRIDLGAQFRCGPNEALVGAGAGGSRRATHRWTPGLRELRRNGVELELGGEGGGERGRKNRGGMNRAE